MTTDSIQSLTLTSVTEQFKHWRATRKSRRTPVPDALRQQTLDLLNHHSKSQVIQALGINYKMIQHWQYILNKGEAAIPSSSASTPTFVAFDLPTSSTATAPSPVDFTVSAHGQSLRIQGSMTLAQLTAFAQGLRPSEHGA